VDATLSDKTDKLATVVGRIKSTTLATIDMPWQKSVAVFMSLGQSYRGDLTIIFRDTQNHSKHHGG